MMLADFSNIGDLFKREEHNDVFGVIEKRMRKAENIKVFAFVPKLALTMAKLKILDMQGKDFDPEFVRLFREVIQMVPVYTDFVHYTYELYRQIEINRAEDALIKYAVAHGRKRLQFANNYYGNRNASRKVMICLALLNDDGLTMDNCNEERLSTQVMHGSSKLETMSSEYNDVIGEYSEEIKQLLKDKYSDNTDASLEHRKLAEQYHQKYMEANVYPYLPEDSIDSISRERVFNLALKLHKGKRTI